MNSSGVSCSAELATPNFLRLCSTILLANPWLVVSSQRPQAASFTSMHYAYHIKLRESEPKLTAHIQQPFSRQADLLCLCVLVIYLLHVNPENLKRKLEKKRKKES